MTERILGPTGPRRRRRLGLLLTAASIAALLLVIGAGAFNPTVSNFEIDGDPTTGVSTGGSGGSTVSGVDWSKGATEDCNPAAGQPTGDPAGDVAPCNSALVFNSANAVDGNPAGGTNPTDNPLESGHATFFRDDLKVDPGGDDTTFTNGDKENECTEVSSGVCQTFTEGSDVTSKTPYSIVEGSVPPNKDDLFDIYTYVKIVGNQADVVLGAIRTNSNGDSHIDYELNKRAWEACVVPPGTANTLCPRRTEGDLLIAYDISNTSPTEVRFFRWDLPGGIDAGIVNGVNRHGAGQAVTTGCDGQFTDNPAVKSCPWEEVALPAAAVVSVLNTNANIAAPVWGSRTPNGAATGTLSQFAFFETFLDFDQLGLGPSCPGFAVASAKSRASTSVDAALHDLAGPFPIDLNTCGKITIIKDTVPSPDPQDFSYSTTGGLSPSSFILDDDADATRDSQQVYNQVNPGNYSVTEAAVTGYSLTSLTCTATPGSSGTQAAPGSFTANITVANLGEVTCTYVNTLARGAIKVTKLRKHAASGPGNHPHSGVTFTVNGVSKQTDANGVACFDNLPFATYAVTETVPAGYSADATSKNVTVDNAATCADATYVGETVSFLNTPLTNVTVTVDSQVAGGTSSTIECEPTANDPDAGPGDDITVTVSNLPPGSLVCTVVIDP